MDAPIWIRQRISDSVMESEAEGSAGLEVALPLEKVALELVAEAEERAARLVRGDATVGAFDAGGDCSC